MRTTKKGQAGEADEPRRRMTENDGDGDGEALQAGKEARRETNPQGDGTKPRNATEGDRKGAYERRIGEAGRKNGKRTEERNGRRKADGRNGRDERHERRKADGRRKRREKDGRNETTPNFYWRATSSDIVWTEGTGK